MSLPGTFFMRWRVRLGYPLAVVVLWFSRPAPRSILLGGLVGMLGLCLRSYAAGYLHKQEVLTVSGPYAYTRNPLYLGSATMALGAAVATLSWVSASLLLLYFALFYFTVMRREEKELRLRHGAAFREYARAVPLFFPRLRPWKLPAGSSEAFSFAQYKKNHEWRAALGFLLLLGVLVLLAMFAKPPHANFRLRAGNQTASFRLSAGGRYRYRASAIRAEDARLRKPGLRREGVELRPSSFALDAV